jgi:hypothetical protein
MAAKNPTLTTPTGRLKYPNLVKERDFKGDGKFAFDTKMILEGEAAASFMATCDAHMVAAQKELKKPKGRPPYAPVLDKDGNEVPGQIEVKFRVPARWKSGESRRPKQYKGDGTPVEGGVANIGGGTRARIFASVYYREHAGTAGISLQPLAIQIVELVEYQGGAPDPEFDAVEGAEEFDVASVFTPVDETKPAAGGGSAADF